MDNFDVIEEPQIIPLTEDWNIVLIPYAANKLMGEVIQTLAPEIGDKKWFLVGHGDYIEGVRDVNPYEPGIYMPLMRKDVEAFKPDRVFLGHIHTAPSSSKAFYTGSPCGLDITETGYRYFIIFDTDSNEIIRQQVDNEVLFFQTSLIVFPTEDSLELLGRHIQSDFLVRWDWIYYKVSFPLPKPGSPNGYSIN